MARVRLEYIDLLKLLSILAIITLHAFNVWQQAEIMGFRIYGFTALVKFGVPVFIMISGALLLNREIEIGSFLKKKVNRIVYPFIFFYIITCLFVFLNHHTHEQTQNIFAFRWYFWMILGVYLSIPVINKYILHSKLKELEYFIILFLFAAVFYEITYYFGITQYFYLTLFLSPLGYLVLGYYLSKKEFNMSANKIITLSIIIFALTTFLKSCGIWGYLPFIENYAANTSPMLSSWLDVSFLQIIQAASIFVGIKYLYLSSSGIYSYIKKFLQSNIISKFVLSVSRASDGMYLMNLMPTLLLYYYLQPLTLTGTQVCLTIILASLAIFFISWIIIVILGKIPYIKVLSGYY